jgi:hypothetical protein
MNKSLIGLAGEYHVLAQLAERGLVGALTLGHAKGIDILVTNPSTGTVRKVEVKCTCDAPAGAKLFGYEPFYSWTMSSKHESVQSKDLVYSFVALQEAGMMPRFFLVPSRDVAKYVTWEHRHWLESRKNPGGRDNAMRRFRNVQFFFNETK